LYALFYSDFTKTLARHGFMGYDVIKIVYVLFSYLWYIIVFQVKLKERSMTESANQIPGQEARAVQQEAAETNISRADIERLAQFADYLTRLNLAEYLKLTQKPARIMGLNFISGVARGFGIAVGFTVLSAFVIFLLRQLQVLNLPLIGDFVARVWEYVEMARGIRI
jgi:hypothetical protein